MKLCRRTDVDDIFYEEVIKKSIARVQRVRPE
jgi:hypothetical protein